MSANIVLKGCGCDPCFGCADNSWIQLLSSSSPIQGVWSGAASARRGPGCNDRGGKAHPRYIFLSCEGQEQVCSSLHRIEQRCIMTTVLMTKMSYDDLTKDRSTCISTGHFAASIRTSLARLMPRTRQLQAVISQRFGKSRETLVKRERRDKYTMGKAKLRSMRIQS